MNEIKKTSEQKLREVAEAALMEAAIVGECKIKMTIYENTKEIHFEILNPFQGCECDES